MSRDHTISARVLKNTFPFLENCIKESYNDLIVAFTQSRFTFNDTVVAYLLDSPYSLKLVYKYLTEKQIDMFVEKYFDFIRNDDLLKSIIPQLSKKNER